MGLPVRVWMVRHAESAGDSESQERAIEDDVQAVICQTFGLSPTMPTSVKAADNVLLRTEQRDLMTMPEGWVSTSPAIWPQRLVAMPPAEAKQRFIWRFDELMRRRQP